MADDIVQGGGRIRLGATIRSLHTGGTDSAVRADLDDGELIFDRVVICAGLHGDRLAISAATRRTRASCPFAGEYFELVAGRRDLVRALVYPVPKPNLPFLGVHFTRHVDGSVSIGPNAVLALAREGYRGRQIDAATTLELLRGEGFRKMARTYWASGLSRVRRIDEPAALSAPGTAIHPRAEVVGFGRPVGRHPGTGGGSQRAARRRLRRAPPWARRRRSQRPIAGGDGVDGHSVTRMRCVPR